MSMASQRAEQIFNEYDAVLQAEKKKYQTIFPVSFLPYPAAVLKDAIKTLAAHLKSVNKLGPEMLDRLKSAYMSLATFVSQEDADFVQNYKDSLATAVDKGFAGESKKFQFITNKVRNHEEDLSQEARIFFSKLLHDKPL